MAIIAYHFLSIIPYCKNDVVQAYYCRIIRALYSKIVALFLAYIVEN